ncbi:Bacilysin biosynthesis oxidoreductase [Lecanosticta acicola]|uniref:Bacilysin biosynthesis oxidoreductase n=1 Tax=Lecanosticta acicola TaxID=111012 RepID=A0AAI8Z3D2_9PEZI|nr:Bacilysin biosynthesis oxidoreductase [Lecanosticta acicola]
MDRGKTVLVTGGAGGLGRAIAEAFVESGASVVICDINRKLLDDFQEKVVLANPDRVLAIESDITSETALDDLFSQAEKKFGAFDWVVNSAGLCDKFDPAGDLERAEYDKIIAVNLTAPTFITKRAVNKFLKNEKKGSIVNIASVASFRGFANGAAYTISKHGLIGLTRNTAAFYRLKGIRCNAIQAGAMPTNIGAHLANGINQEGMGIMQKTFGDWEGALTETTKMAKLVRFLCSDDSEMLNGAVVTADGGITAI